MTNDPTVPGPRTPDGDKAAAREAALQALASRSGPRTPPGDAAVLADTVLLHTSWDTAQTLLDQLPSTVGGLVLRGSEARVGARKLRHAGFSRPIVVDPEGYAAGLATEDAPFVLPEADGLFAPSLNDVLQTQRDNGASVTLTPTGYLRAGDSDALRAAVRAAAEIDRDDVIFSAPLDVKWFTNDHIDHLITVLSRLQRPKALFLGGQFDPMARYRDAVFNLRRAVTEAGDIAILRTDLTGLDAMAHGAFAASIGSGGTLRHMVPFGQFPRAGKERDPSPTLLVGDLMTYYKGSTLHDRYADTPAPACGCLPCQGRHLDSFTGKKDSTAAHRHSLHTWANWIEELHAQPSLDRRAAWWRALCAQALATAELVNMEINQPDGFTPPATLKAWAELPTWPTTVTAPVTRRARTR